jgi:hypothetical protein
MIKRQFQRESNMANKTELGPNAYLWTPTAGVTTSVVISAHGGTNGKRFVSRKGTSYVFFSAPTTSAYGSLDKVLHPDQEKDRTDCKHDKAAWNTVDDYILSKFQGKHGNDSESYGDIKQFVDSQGLSVISIRNRTGSKKRADDNPVTLEQIYRLVEAKHPGKVDEYKCLFCRVDATGTSQYKDMLTGKAFNA